MLAWPFCQITSVRHMWVLHNCTNSRAEGSMLDKISIPVASAGVVPLGGIFLFALDSVYLAVTAHAAAGKKEGTGSVFANFRRRVAGITPRFPAFSRTQEQPQARLQAPHAPETPGEALQMPTSSLNKGNFQIWLSRMVGVEIRLIL